MFRYKYHNVFLAYLFLPQLLGTVHGEEAPLQIRSDIRLDPKRQYSGLEILASNITIDGQGAIIEGDMRVSPKERQGVGIQGKNIQGVRLKNVTVRGFGTGIELVDCGGLVIENCNFSDNASDPDFGWGESTMRGGIYLERVIESQIRNCTAQRNWNNCELMHCSKVTIEGCDFSVASNTCLSMRGSSRNSIVGNNLSYGIRIAPDEVHARDSTCVLIEGGCNQNELRGNDCRFGGDGIFVRAIGSSISIDNLFRENDCSYAHNNAIECGSPKNRFVGNIANHSSYGMWMGGSDQTEIIENEVCFNGLRLGHHNSPHLPDNCHAGIIYMFATAENILIRGNRCIGNNGAGIALLGFTNREQQQLRPTNVMIEDNFLLENRWGIYLENAKLTWVQANLLQRNLEDSVLRSEGEAMVVESGSAKAVYEHQRSRRVAGAIQGPAVVRVGETARYGFKFTGNFAPTHGDQAVWEWIVDGQVVSREPFLDFKPLHAGAQTISVRYAEPQLFASNWSNVCVLLPVTLRELGDEEDLWREQSASDLAMTFSRDSLHSLGGVSSTRIDINPYHGVRAYCELSIGDDRPLAEITESTQFSFWIDSLVTASLGWQDFNPEVTIIDSGGRRGVYRPINQPMNLVPDRQNRIGWQRIHFNLKNLQNWRHEGEQPVDVHKIVFGFDTWEYDPIRIWIDQLTVGDIQQQPDSP